MFNTLNITGAVNDMNEQFAQQVKDIQTFLGLAIPMKLLEFASVQKFVQENTSVSALYQYIISEEVMLTFFDALKEELLGKELSKHAHHIVNATKNVIQREIHIVADDMVKNFVLLLVEQNLIEFKHPLFQFEKNKELVVASLRSLTIKEMYALIQFGEQNHYTDSAQKEAGPAINALHAQFSLI